MTNVYAKSGAVDSYKDGGTTAYQGWDGKKYFVDHRISSKTKGAVYDRYPSDKGAKILNVKLVFCSEPPDTDGVQAPSRKELLERMQNYLEVGGLFNPEMMEHDKVRSLIMDCREYLIRHA